MFAGAGLSQAVWDQLDQHGEAAVGERIRIFTGLGMTETSPSCTFAVGAAVQSGDIGLPVPGVEVKLVPDAEGSGKTEIRFRGPNVMPGYWRMPEHSAEAFDDEGFYRTGDAVVFKDAADPPDLAQGLRFDGRIAEDFKLATGTFVSVGPLRAKVILAGDPMVQDVVVAGLNRDHIGLLIFPRLDEIRRKFALPADWAAAQVLAAPAVRDAFRALMDRLWAGRHRQRHAARRRAADGHAAVDRPRRGHRQGLDQPARRARPAHAEVERLYAETLDADVIVPRR